MRSVTEIRRAAASGLAVLVLAGPLAGPLAGQADTTRRTGPGGLPRYRLDDITVVGHRTPTARREGASAVTVLSRDDLDRLPGHTLADALSIVPGLLFLERDGSGQLPMAVARGFFGGGETEYVLVAIDGVPANDLRTGTVEWSRLPAASIERIEVQRGAGSSVYGDAALGAVVNIVTRAGGAASGVTGRVEAGAWGGLLAQASGGGRVGGGSLAVDASGSTLDGYRAHAGSTDLSASVAYRQTADRDLRFRAGAAASRIEKDEPGALPVDDAGRDPRRSHPLFGADHRRRHTAGLSAGLTRGRSSSDRLDVDLSFERVGEDETSTLLLTPGFGDTQRSEESNWSLWSRVEGAFAPGSPSSSLVTGVETAYGEYEIDYFEPGDGASRIGRGAGGRLKMGAYAELRQRIGARWTAFAGARYDRLSLDRHAGADEPTAVFSRLSPRFGVNVSYLERRGATGNAWASWSRSFKAPTLEQLYGARRIPTGVPGETIGFSNDLLRPQTATGLEVGIHQRVPVGSGHAELSLSGYRLDVDDEIDFDLATFRFANIVESRHEGLEAAVAVSPVERLAVRHSLTVSRVVFRSGESEGNQLKNIPRTSASTAVMVSPRDDLELSLTHGFVGEAFLDDANAASIPSRHTFGAAIGWRVRSVRVRLSAENLFDTHASSLGFTLFDPATGERVPFVYPLGGRSVRLALALDR